MIRMLFLFVTFVHGLIHLLGFAKAMGYAELPQLAQPITRPQGLLWLAASLLLIATVTSFVWWPRGWWLAGLLAVVVSQTVIASSWGDAKFGTIANAILLVGVAYGFASQGPLGLRASYERAVAATASVPTPEALTEADLGHLPGLVQRYVRGSGAVGQLRVHNFRVTWIGRIRNDPASPWMAFTAKQFNTLATPRRFFLMDATMKGLPVDVLHAFDEGGATMRVKLLSCIPMVDAKGATLTRSETVTLFNDLCVLAPGALVSPSITWEPIDAHAVRARFVLRANTISAELHFNDQAELVDFISDDRSRSLDGRDATLLRWTTPLRDYAQVGPARISTRGEARWHPASGAFSYGEFNLQSLEYNVGP